MGLILDLRATLEGHTNWVTSICVPADPSLNKILSASRDKSIIIWELNHADTNYAFARRALKGHAHFVQEVVMSSDGQFCLSCSWDGTLKLWNINTGCMIKHFFGHCNDVLSAAISPCGSFIISGSRDKTIRIWNIQGECKFVFEGHSAWVSCVRFLHSTDISAISCAWDGLVKIWDLEKSCLKCNLVGHTGYVNTVAVTLDGSICASGGKDGFVILWNVAECKKLYQLDSGDVINALCFSPCGFWLCAATQSSIRIWDLKSNNILEDIHVMECARRPRRVMHQYCTCLQWSTDGSTLFAGCTDAKIRVYSVKKS